MAQSSSERIHPGALASLPPLPPRPFVSVVIPTWNEERYIGALLASLEAQTYPAEAMEVIVADGGSTDATREIIAAAAARWKTTPLILVDNPARKTPEGRNAGFAVSRGQVILTLIGHTTLDPTFVEESVRALRETGAAVAGGPMVARGDTRIAAAIAAATSHPFGIGGGRFHFATEPGYVDTVPWGAYRRECFEILGGFATDRELAEDDFFNYEVRAAGGKLYLTPAIKSVYYPRSTFRPLARQYFGYGRAKGRASVEVPSSILPRHLVPGATVAGGALLLAASVFSRRARWLLALGGSAYAGLAAYSANTASSRRGDPTLAPRVALVFPVLHASYGIGTIVGAVRTLRARRGR